MYKPNFNDPRVQRRINTSLDYAIACLSTTKPKAWGTRQIDKWFGDQSNPLSQMIRSELLILSDPYYNPLSHKSKKYLLNMDGAVKLAGLVGRTIIPCAVQLKPTQVECATRIYGDQIAQGAFEYREKSNRLWNDIQNLDNTTRKTLFANYGYVHEYDIKSAAPNILLQYATSLGLRRNLPTINAYLADSDSHRQVLSEYLGCSITTAKQLITQRFAGARFGARNSIMQTLNFNWHQYRLLKDMPWYESLTKEIKLMWDAIRDYHGNTRLNSRAKWNLYFQEELRVMQSVHKYLDRTNVKYFHEHDGWRSTGSVDIRALKLHVRKATGYWLEFDQQVFETTIETNTLLNDSEEFYNSDYH